MSKKDPTSSVVIKIAPAPPLTLPANTGKVYFLPFKERKDYKREIKEHGGICADQWDTDQCATHQPKVSKVLLLDLSLHRDLSCTCTCLDNMSLTACRPVYTRV
jgi:hypothetical protein